MRTKLSAGRPLLWNRCETGSWAIPGRRSKLMPNVAAAGGRPAENGATPGSESLYLWKSTIGAAAAQPRRRGLRRRRLRGQLLGARPLRVSALGAGIDAFAAAARATE